MNFLDVTRGDSPLIFGLPHTGTELPEECAARLNSVGQALSDTDWHIHTLYEGLVPNVTTVRTRIHRYFIDVNRDPTGNSLYPGQNTTSLCPLTDFDGTPIYREGTEPDGDETEHRRAQYHAPYHAALQSEMERVTNIHGFAVLYDCHSIRSTIPFLFDGVLPDFNIGTNNGSTCSSAVEAATINRCESATDYTFVLNGRFKGGWTTRRYGQTQRGWRAIQMELAKSTYLTEETPPWKYDTDKAEKLRVHLRQILEALQNWRPA